jgi:hypothetical protein
MNPQRTSLPQPEQTGEPNVKNSADPIVTHMLELTTDELQRLPQLLPSMAFTDEGQAALESILKKISILRTGIAP